MPFEAKGNKVYAKATGKVVGRSKSPAEAARAARTRNVVYTALKPKDKKGPARSSKSAY